LDARLEHAPLVDALVVEHTVVAHPVLVDGGVLARTVAIDLLIARIEIGKAAAARGAADAGAARRAQEPDARLEPEVARGERADWAHVLGHQGIAVVELPTRGDRDLVQVAALAHAEHRIFGQLFGDANAARAHDAAL